MNIICNYQFLFLYLMNFVFHTMLDAASELLLIVHYKGMKCDASFSQGIVSTICSQVDIFSYMCRKFLPVYNSAKLIKINQYFSKLCLKMYCHFFMVHSVHTQSIYEVNNNCNTNLSLLDSLLFFSLVIASRIASSCAFKVSLNRSCSACMGHKVTI